MFPSVLSVTILVFLVTTGCNAARILAVFPTPSISHQVVFRRLTVELANRGHELIIFTSDPINDSRLKNYTEIDLHYTYKLVLNYFDHVDDYWALLEQWNLAMEKVTRAVLSNAEMQRIIEPGSNEHFDLILVEYFTSEAIYGLMKRFDAPMVGITSMPLLSSSHYAIGNPLAMAYIPGIEIAMTDDMSFWQRLENAYITVRNNMAQFGSHLRMQNNLAKTFFGPETPCVGDLAADVSLVLVNSHTLLSYPRPNLPGIIEIGGISLNRTLKGINDDLKQFLDGAANGFVYFSLGTNAKSESLPKEKLTALIGAFSELPYKVLWKWEQDSLPGKPDNVFIAKWLPQYDVLAHPNIEAFVYQGGIQSTEEAIDNAVPLIGIPIFGDQQHNVLKLESAGVAARIDFQNLSKEIVKNTIMKVISDKSYKEKMIKFREILNDRPEDPVKVAAWWTEYVIRHKGAPHLRTRVRKMPWYQRELLDVVAFLTLIAILIVYVTYKMIISLLLIITRPKKNTTSRKVKVR